MVISNQFQQNSPGSVGELLFWSFIYEPSWVETIWMSVICLEQWNRSHSGCVEADVLCARIRPNQKENEWVHVLFLLGFTYWADNLFQLRRAVALVTAEGAVLHWIKSPFENNQDWLIVAGREREVFQERARKWGCSQAAPAEPKELGRTTAEGGGGLGGMEGRRMAVHGMRKQINYVAEIN